MGALAWKTFIAAVLLAPMPPGFALLRGATVMFCLVDRVNRFNSIVCDVVNVLFINNNFLCHFLSMNVVNINSNVNFGDRKCK